MKAHGLTWTQVVDGDVLRFAVNGWVAYSHPSRPMVMLARGDARRFVVRGQIYDTYSQARRIA